VEPIKYAYFIRKILFDRVCRVSSSDVCESNEESETIVRSISDGVVYTVLGPLKSINNPTSSLALLICDFSLLILIPSIEFRLLYL
jgi:hypothetical protein